MDAALQPDTVCYSSVLNACAQAGAAQLAESWLLKMGSATWLWLSWLSELSAALRRYQLPACSAEGPCAGEPGGVQHRDQCLCAGRGRELSGTLVYWHDPGSNIPEHGDLLQHD